jgi:hypothetical protein
MVGALLTAAARGWCNWLPRVAALRRERLFRCSAAPASFGHGTALHPRTPAPLGLLPLPQDGCLAFSIRVEEPREVLKATSTTVMRTLNRLLRCGAPEAPEAAASHGPVPALGSAGGTAPVPAAVAEPSAAARPVAAGLELAPASAQPTPGPAEPQGPRATKAAQRAHEHGPSAAGAVVVPYTVVVQPLQLKQLPRGTHEYYQYNGQDF